MEIQMYFTNIFADEIYLRMSRHHYEKCTKLIISVYISRVYIPLT